MLPHSMQPLVSIIIPIYQVSDYIERCLLSVMKQTYTDIECLLVDDASMDDSIEKCKRLINTYQGHIRFKILQNNVNKGVSASRNTGTYAATGDYLFYLDSDDEITHDCIEKLITYAIEDEDLQMVQGRYINVTDTNNWMGRSAEVRIISNDEARNQYLYWRNLNYSVCNKLLKRDFVINNKLYFKEGLVNEDFLWTFYLIKHLSNALLCDEVTYYYFTRPNSIRTGEQDNKMCNSYISIFNEILSNLTPGKERGELKGYQTTFCWAIARYMKNNPAIKAVCKYYKKQARLYHVWSALISISVVSAVSRFCNMESALGGLNQLQLKVKKLLK